MDSFALKRPNNNLIFYLTTTRGKTGASFGKNPIVLGVNIKIDIRQMDPTNWMNPTEPGYGWMHYAPKFAVTSVLIVSPNHFL